MSVVSATAALPPDPVQGSMMAKLDVLGMIEELLAQLDIENIQLKGRSDTQPL